jgi:hypothetical protein
MKIFKNVFTGFVISYFGALPLGYLNLFGLNLYSVHGIIALSYFLLGIVTVEIIIVASTLRGAMWLSNQKKLVLLMEILSVAILLVFAYAFFYLSKAKTPSESNYSFSIHPYLLGLTLSTVNIFQIPFWIGWNLIVVSTKRITTTSVLSYFYILGTALGTLAGMTTFILAFQFILSRTGKGMQWMDSLIPLIFLGIAIFQIFKLLFRNNTKKIISIQTYH